MKLKELERPAVQVWSPASQHPIYLATGTSAQQLDASFSTNAALEIFEVDFRDPSVDLQRKGVFTASSRFHKLIWGNAGNGPPENSGVIAGGGDNGVITLFSAAQILASGKEPVIGQREKHTGPVRALDFNPFQGNLLASGANDSEIYIWDLNNFSVPMTPGSKSQYREPPEDVSALCWNWQVQHILSSAHPSGKAVVWDLRKNEPIIKVSDHSNRMHCSAMAWHPEVATQLVLSSEDDRLPVIQVWDLRFASSPLKVLENHSRGVLSVSWCQADPELLLSSAKDNRILCWNPGSGEVVYELPTRSRWCFDVQWCPRNPSVFAAASFDGWINLYSVMGGSLEAQQRTQADKISSSFGNLDPFGTGQPLPPLQVPEQVVQTTLVPPLKKPPKWIRRPVGGSFAFGGKLVTFGVPSFPAQQTPQPCPRLVFVSQVTTEPEFLTRSAELQEALGSGNLLDYCQDKIQRAKLQFEKSVWQFLKVNLEQESRPKLLKLLGYSEEELREKIAASGLGNGLGSGESRRPEGDDLNWNKQPFPGQGSRESGEPATSSSSSAFFDELIPQNLTSLEIPVTADTDGLISQALLLGNLDGAVDLCVREERFADAIILAVAGGEKLLRQTQQRYFAKKKTKLSSLLSSIVQHRWRDVVCTCSLQNWREAMAILLTYSSQEEYAGLCDTLGARLESEGDGTLSTEACLCYICSGNVERLVECWGKIHKASSPVALQDLVEKVMVLSRSLELLRGPAGASPGPAMAGRVTDYASLLASQGRLAAAMSYLPTDSSQHTIQQLRERLFHAQGASVIGQQPPPFPFPRVHVGAPPPPQTKSSVAAGGSQPRRPGMRPPDQVSAPSPMPSVFTPQPIPAPTHPGPPQGPIRAPTASYPRTSVPRLAYPTYAVPGPTLGPAMPQPFNPRGGPAPGPVGFPGGPPAPRQPVRMAPPGALPPGPTFLPPGPAPAPHLSASLTCPVSMGSQPPGPFSFPTAYPQGGPGAPPSGPLPAAGIPPPPSGPQESWSEPSSRGGLQKQKMAPPAPITAPVMNLPPGGVLLHGPPGHETGQAPPGAPQELNLQFHQLPPERVERKELPPEHLPLKTTFEGLVQRCSLVAADPKTKRKLEEATQRLECLYEKLRERALSPHILAGLHEIARCMEARSYQQGLLVHTQVVGSSSFSEVSGFMPVLKAVLTIAHKLNV
ncbi:protein transport protein Sec31B isoform X1 [Ornithorhynchus anatinus]|uniref:protein transport protein Sec31B isoform X1 n=1 Tax=Ornithorhynchus anatinus TaxID=9258 RepID=UPI0010A9151F|nr:protein transport protein Sec31B isoform X1 [Ornithorhynchus anatinus]